MSNKRPSKSTKELLKAAKLPERSVDICVRGDLVAEHQEADRQLREAREDEANNKRVGGGKSAELARKVEALEAEMREATATIRLRALPRRKWREIADDHPPRKGNKGDEAVGVHLEAFLDAVTPLCIVDPELDADEWADLSDALSDGEYDRLTIAVWDLNRRKVDVPKSLLASQTARRSEGD